METDKQAKADDQQVQVNEPTNELEKRLEKLESQYKSEIAGLNRKISEKDEALKRFEREKMTEAERIEAERKEIETERARISAERLALTNQKIIESELRSAGLPLEFAKRIQGQNESDIKSDVLALKDLFQTSVTQVVEKTVNERLSGKPPKSTEEQKNTITRTEFDKLSDYERMTKIKAGVSVVEG